MRRVTLLAATTLTALSLAAASRAEPRFDFDHTPGKLPKTVVPESYTIDIVPDMQKLTLTGHETVELTVRQPVDSITLNQAGPEHWAKPRWKPAMRPPSARTTRRRPRR